LEIHRIETASEEYTIGAFNDRVYPSGPKERAAFQIVLKRRAYVLLIASARVQNIRQFVPVITS
jgi:hypothetical protein